jgi:hypothetical protein
MATYLTPHEKTCRICGQDCSDRPRTKDRKGRYYCRECYEETRKSLMARAAVPGSEARPIERADSPTANPVEVEPDGDEAAESEWVVLEPDSPAVHTEASLCPSCGGIVPANSAICARCGHNKRTGQTARAGGAAVAASEAAVLLGYAAKNTGMFMLGCLISGIGALVGAGVWCLIALITNREAGLVAWGIGVVAGLGMTLGYRRQNNLAGVVAAGFSVAAILIGKFAIFSFVIHSILTGEGSSLEMDRTFLVVAIGNEILDERGVMDKDRRKAEWPTVRKEVGKRLEGKSPTEIRRMAREQREKLRARAFAKETGSEREEGGEEGVPTAQGAPPAEKAAARTGAPRAGTDQAETNESAGHQRSILRAFVKTMFEPIDLLFLGLAVVSAYKIGSGLTTEE